MTGKQIEAAREKFRDDAVVQEELSCREMINSILIYGESCKEGDYPYERYVRPYYEGTGHHDGLISKERVHQLIKEQEYDISQAEIGFAGEDSEGVSYNYCKWADEL